MTKKEATSTTSEPSSSLEETDKKESSAMMNEKGSKGLFKKRSSSPSPPPPPLDAVDDDEENENDEKATAEAAKSYRATRYFRYALLLWIAELVLVVVLKHTGFLTDDSSVESYVFPTKLLDEMLNNKDVFLSQLAEQDWWNVFLKEYNIPLGGATTDKQKEKKKRKRSRPGVELAERGAQAKYPVLMLPGFVTSGLEFWSGHGECARNYHFRQRLWTAVGSATSFLADRDCWRQHMLLHPHTGSDPHPDIRLRAASGFDAVDYFLGNYWVFGKILENLADVGYSPSNMAVEPYDWRLAFPVLEQRDGYLTKLRLKIEAMRQASGRKVVLTSHSMGALLVTYFFQWVTTDKSLGGGGGGADWVDEHIHAYVNIAGTHLGVPKAATALVSGEMSDTIYPQPMGNLVEQLFGRSLRRGLWGTWGSLWSMLPRGGDALWGIGADLNCPPGRHDGNDNVENVDEALETPVSIDDTDSEQDLFCPRSTGDDQTTKLSPIFVMTDEVPELETEQHDDGSSISKSTNEETAVEMAGENHVDNVEITAALDALVSRQEHSIRNVLDYLRSFGGGYGKTFSNVQFNSLYEGDEDDDDNVAHNRQKRKADNDKALSLQRTWHDPTQTPLPHAPNMRIYCMYGVGVPTERAYYYKRNHGDSGNNSGAANNSRDAATAGMPKRFLDPPIILDPSVNNPDQSVTQGVRYADGDGSVPLLSLGYICTDAWQRSDSGLNPSNAPVITREYQHKTEFVVDDPMRGGPNSADHVDILGNVDMMQDLLRIATDFEPEELNQNQIVSDIERIAQEINRHPKGGIYQASSRRRKRQQGRKPEWFSFLF